MYEFNGVVKKVGDLQTFASGFTKRELVVEEEKDGGWKNVVAFSFKKDNAAKLDGVTPGTRVKVTFSVDGREWTDPKTGKVKYFSDLTGQSIDVVSFVTGDEPAADALGESDDGEIPF